MKQLIIITSLIIFPFFLFSQDTDDQAIPEFEETQQETEKSTKFDWDKVTIEPSLGLAISNNVVYFGLSGYFGYEVLPKLILGPGIVYYYTRYKDQGPTGTDNIDLYTIGGGIFAQYYVYKAAFLRAKFEFLNRKILLGYVGTEPQYKKTNVPVLLLGAGYNLTMGSKVQFPIYVAYDVIQDDDSPYYSSGFPLYIQIGFVTYF